VTFAAPSIADEALYGITLEETVRKRDGPLAMKASADSRYVAGPGKTGAPMGPGTADRGANY